MLSSALCSFELSMDKLKKVLRTQDHRYLCSRCMFTLSISFLKRWQSINNLNKVGHLINKQFFMSFVNRPILTRFRRLVLHSYDNKKFQPIRCGVWWGTYLHALKVGLVNTPWANPIKLITPECSVSKIGCFECHISSWIWMTKKLLVCCTYSELSLN